MIKLIAGLGNPGPKYSNSYHNAGIIAIEAMPHGKWRHVKGKKFEAAKSANYIFIKPLTFMNESGVAIRESLRYFKIKPENMGLVHDDSDIYLGKYKLSRGRGAAGHKGVQSVIESVGTKNFWRLRIGIRP
ncbi:MAG: peptidyl-tRNA hydrolase, partial [Candidatus Liptonbacteria bacterium]|nr:peptidyl-tRNA hydrolase [Candidatus Liptonbacteria bacterium]